MKGWGVYFSVMVIGCWCQAAEPVAIPVENGGFENGLDGWTVRNGEGVAAAPEAAHGGQSGLRVPTNGKASIHALAIPIDFGKKYRISCWVKGIGSIPMSLSLGFRNDAGKYIEAENPNAFKLSLPAGAEWQHFTREFVPPDGAVSLLVSLSTWAPAGKTGGVPIDVDEITLEEISEAD